MMYHNPQAVVQVNGKCSEAFMIGPAELSSVSSMSLLWSSYSLGLGIRREVWPCMAFFLLALFRQRYPCMLMISVSRHLDIKAVKKAVVRYKQIAGAKINWVKVFNKVPGEVVFSCHWSDGSVHILGMGFGPSLQLEWNWLEVQVKVDAQVGTWLWRQLSLKGRAEVCAIFPTRTYLHQLCADTGCSLEDLLGAVDDRDGWRESQGNPSCQPDLMMMM